MKLASKLASDMTLVPKANMVNMILNYDQVVRLEAPKLSSEVHCFRCGQTEKGMTCRYDPASCGDIAWFCGNPDCMKYFKDNKVGGKIAPSPKRALSWEAFCQSNGLGDLNHKIRFETLDHDEKKILHMRNFAQKPTGIALFIGQKGSGKTYACLAILELYTRSNRQSAFYTADTLQDAWLSEFKGNAALNLKYKLKELSLLVIDDFAQKEPPPGFMGFVFDVINYRMQWSDKGTIITTNISLTQMAQYCGEALNDRISSASLKINFDSKISRRRQVKP